MGKIELDGLFKIIFSNFDFDFDFFFWLGQQKLPKRCLNFLTDHEMHWIAYKIKTLNLVYFFFEICFSQKNEL